MVEERAPLPGSEGAVRVSWRANNLVRASRASGLFSLAFSLGLMAIAAASLVAGDRSLLTFIALLLSFLLTDGALTRLMAASRAPREVGISELGVHFRMQRGEQVVPWSTILDVRHSAFGPRPDFLRITLRAGPVLGFQGVPGAIATEVKLSWLEATTRERGLKRATVRAPAPGGRELPLSGDLEPTAAPQFWLPQPAEQARPPSGGEMPEPQGAVGPRPAWSYTLAGDGVAQPDPRYASAYTAARPFVWHFIPAGRTRAGGAFLLAALILAGIAIARIAADVLLSLAGLPSDPWIANGVGLAAGLAMALLVWHVARGELAGEVAGSVLFLPAFDRTKADLALALRDAGASIGVGVPRERRSRGRLVVSWPGAHTRAMILQASPDTRAIVLKTTGRSNYEVHTRLKGVILERLRPPTGRR